MHAFRALILATAAATSTAFAAGPGDAAGPYAPIDPAQVTVGGEIGQRIDLTIHNNLLAIEVEHQFLDPFRLKQSQPYDYVGLGKLIDSTVSFARYSKDPRVIALKNQLVTELIATQLPDGYIGTFPAGSRIRELFDEHEMAYNLHALVNNYTKCHDQPSLTAAGKLADYYIANYDAAAATRDPALVCKIDIERAMIALSEATGNTQYRDYIVNRSDLRHWQAPMANTDHFYTVVNLCLAQLDLYREQPDQTLLTQSRRVNDYLTDNNGLLITGTCSLNEKFNNTQQTLGPVGETCATAYLIRMEHNLLQLEGKSADGDIMERAIYNALFAAQSPDGRQLRYFTAIEGQRQYYNTDTYCCPNNFRRIVAELPEMIYYKNSGNGLAVNLYTPSEATVALNGGVSLKVTQTGDYLDSGHVAIQLDPSQSARFPLELRIPKWCKNDVSVDINGQAWDGTISPGTFLTIDRQWNAGDEVTLDMPMTWRFVLGRGLQTGLAALMRGPIVYCLDPSENAALGGLDVASLKSLVIDPTSVIDLPGGDPFDGMACQVRATGFGETFLLTLTKFRDPQGRCVYFHLSDMSAAVPDELVGIFAVPEPGSILILIAGLLGLLAYVWRRQR
jgi:uncharacterized protein